MNFIESLQEKLRTYQLLNHPFYQAWNAGALIREGLQTYAKEYYHHVAAFPRYISGIHSLCGDLKARQILLGNLIEEEQGEENHPELWTRFAEGLGVDRDELMSEGELPETRALVYGYFELVKSGYAQGLGALYAYERQTPDVSQSKIEGLKAHYGINDERSLKFFNVHKGADVWHSQECERLIEQLDEEGQQQAAKGAEAGAKLLWGFLDGMMRVHPCEEMKGIH